MSHALPEDSPRSHAPDAPHAAVPSALRVALLVALSVLFNTMVGVFSGEKTRFLYKEVLHLSASDVATLGIFTAIPGYLRFLMGAGADLFPFLGYHRRSYYAVSWLVIALGYVGLAALRQYPIAAVVSLAIVIVAGSNMLFVIMDAVMVRVGNQTGTVGRLQTIQQGLPLLLALTFASPLAGYVTQNWSYTLCFSMSALFAFLGIPLTLLIQEDRVSPASAAHITAEEIARRQEDRRETVAALKQAATSPGLWALVGYVFYLIITPGTNNAQLYYEVDVLKFSKQFIGTLGMPGAAGAIAGILLFAAASKRLPIRSLVWGAYLMDCSLYLISFLLRDQNSALVYSFIASLFGMVYNLCLLTLAARACPPKAEGAVYGLVVAAITLAGTLGEKMGSSIYDYFGPAHGYTTVHGWYSLLWFGYAFTVIACVFIPFLPAWTRSSDPLRPAESSTPAETAETVETEAR